MRARGFALRDAFPDALRGIQVAEEQMDAREVTLRWSEATEIPSGVQKINAAVPNPKPEGDQAGTGLGQTEAKLEPEKTKRKRGRPRKAPEEPVASRSEAPPAQGTSETIAADTGEPEQPGGGENEAFPWVE